VRHHLWIAIAWLLSIACSPSPTQPGGAGAALDLAIAADDLAPPPDGGPESPWVLTWSDEFNGPAGAVDGTRWSFDVGTGTNGWGNNELEYYTSRVDNVTVDGAGALEIIARKEAFMGASYTSGRINTAGKFSQAYGRFEARIQVAEGQGLWPAFWTLGDNLASAGWPGCGELDI
jgi:beta-glucanase (GH16 family)